MSWNFSSKYLKKTLCGLEYDCLKLSIVKLEKILVENADGMSVEETKEIESSNVNLFIKKDTNGNVFLIFDNTIVENITKTINKINPMMIFVVQMFIPMFKPMQCKFDVDNKQVLELFLNTQKIDVSDNLSSFNISSFTNMGLQSQFMNFDLFSTQSNINAKKLDSNNNEEDEGDENEDENEDESEDENENEDGSEEDDGEEITESDESTDDETIENKNENEIDKKLELLLDEFGNMKLNDFDNSMKNIDVNNLVEKIDEFGLGNLNNDMKNFDVNNLIEKLGGFDLGNLNNLLNNPDIKKIKGIENIENISNISNNIPNTNISNLTSTIGNIWTEKYYDEENLDDFLINENINNKDAEDEINDNLTRYLKLSPDDVSIELSLTNLNDYESLKESVKMLTSREMFDEQIKLYEQNELKSDGNIPNIPGTKKWVGADNEGNKCLYYTFGSNSETKNFEYKHFQQLEIITLELITFIQQM